MEKCPWCGQMAAETNHNTGNLICYARGCNFKGTPEEVKLLFDAHKKIDQIVKNGHSRHCACRQVWGDGECECDLYKLGYDPYAWIRRAK